MDTLLVYLLFFLPCNIYKLLGSKCFFVFKEPIHSFVPFNTDEFVDSLSFKSDLLRPS